MINLLTVDVEDWFHVEAFAQAIDRKGWQSLEFRAQSSIERLLGLFERHNVHATFFVLGWIAERYPDIVRKIADRGHEVASHGMSHTPIGNLSPEEFNDEVRLSRKILQDLTGQQVYGYRAPTFSITDKTLWALKILAENGYRYDSSIYPVHHDRYGIPDAPLEIHWRVEGIWEVPLSIGHVGPLRVAFGGGGWLRIYPYPITLFLFKQANRAGRPAVVYVHPWEFDPGQPRVEGISKVRSLRHYMGIERNEQKLADLLSRFRFAPVREVLDLKTKDKE